MGWKDPTCILPTPPTFLPLNPSQHPGPLEHSLRTLKHSSHGREPLDALWHLLGCESALWGSEASQQDPQALMIRPLSYLAGRGASRSSQSRQQQHEMAWHHGSRIRLPIPLQCSLVAWVMPALLASCQPQAPHSSAPSIVSKKTG